MTSREYRYLKTMDRDYMVWKHPRKNGFYNGFRRKRALIEKIIPILDDYFLAQLKVKQLRARPQSSAEIGNIQKWNETRKIQLEMLSSFFQETPQETQDLDQ